MKVRPLGSDDSTSTVSDDPRAGFIHSTVDWAVDLQCDAIQNQLACRAPHLPNSVHLVVDPFCTRLDQEHRDPQAEAEALGALAIPRGQDTRLEPRALPLTRTSELE